VLGQERKIDANTPLLGAWPASPGLMGGTLARQSGGAAFARCVHAGDQDERGSGLARLSKVPNRANPGEGMFRDDLAVRMAGCGCRQSPAGQRLRASRPRVHAPMRSRSQPLPVRGDPTRSRGALRWRWELRIRAASLGSSS